MLKLPAICVLNFQIINFDQTNIFWMALQIIDSFADSVMSVCLTKTEIIAGSVDGTVRTFDIRIGRYVSLKNMITLLMSVSVCVFVFSSPACQLHSSLLIQDPFHP